MTPRPSRPVSRPLRENFIAAIFLVVHNVLDADEGLRAEGLVGERVLVTAQRAFTVLPAGVAKAGQLATSVGTEVLTHVGVAHTHIQEMAHTLHENSVTNI